MAPRAVAQRTKCTATNKRTGQRCNNWAVTGSKVCRMHGGKSLVGPVAPTFTHGRYSKYIPHNLMATYEEGVSDADFLALRDEIGLVDSRIKQLLQELPKGETGGTWDELQDTWKSFINAVRNGNTELQNGLLPRINTLVTRGAADSQRWDQIFDLLERRRKLAETEHKRLVTNNQYVQVSTVMAMMAAMIQGLKDVVERHVEDKDKARRIYVDASSVYRSYLGAGTADTVDSVTVDG